MGEGEGISPWLLSAMLLETRRLSLANIILSRTAAEPLFSQVLGALNPGIPALGNGITTDFQKNGEKMTPFFENSV